MTNKLPTIILRHKKENLKKCSLKGLEKNLNFNFFTYPKDPIPSLSGYILLTLGAKELSYEDHEKALFLIDGTWQYASVMEKSIKQPFEKRSLPKEFVTAYPRKQTKCPDPNSGLSSIEALYVAFVILRREKDYLFENYYWKDIFLEKNKVALKRFI